MALIAKKSPDAASTMSFPSLAVNDLMLHRHKTVRSGPLTLSR